MLVARAQLSIAPGLQLMGMLVVDEVVKICEASVVFREMRFPSIRGGGNLGSRVDDG